PPRPARPPSPTRRSSDPTSTDTAEETPGETDAEQPWPKGYTPAKGHATPTRREAEGKRRGPVSPPPQTTREALKRNKEIRKANRSEEHTSELQSRFDLVC